LAPEAQGEEPVEATVDPDRCPACSRRLSPVWKTRCEHCHTPYSPDLVAARLDRGGRSVIQTDAGASPQEGVLGPAVGCTARHRFVGPLGLGLAAGLTGGGFFIGSSVSGYIVGRAGVGTAGLLLSAGGLLGGLAVVVALGVNSAVSSGCPSCVDALIALPGALMLFLVPFAIGYWLGRRAQRRAQRRAAEGVLAAH
jgi:hypothetical protein